jgi:hypothetical protein
VWGAECVKPGCLLVRRSQQLAVGEAVVAGGCVCVSVGVDVGAGVGVLSDGCLCFCICDASKVYEFDSMFVQTG